jgi:hypothetical protein
MMRESSVLMLQKLMKSLCLRYRQLKNLQKIQGTASWEKFTIRTESYRTMIGQSMSFSMSFLTIWIKVFIIKEKKILEDMLLKRGLCTMKQWTHFSFVVQVFLIGLNLN